MKKHTILVVDDSLMNRLLLKDMLEADYNIIEAKNGHEAISIMSKNTLDISLVLLDIVMPVMNGFEVLKVMNDSHWIEQLPVIIISAETDASFIDQAYDLGAAEYINRPFDEKTILRRVNNTIILYTKQKNLENMVTEQIVEKEKNTQLMVEILSHIVEFRNGESGLHVLHIRIMTEILLRELSRLTDQYHLTPNEITMISNASALHDIGKISIPEKILNKPGKLTTDEFELMKTHTIIGAQMIENSPYHKHENLLKYARDICLWHHERYDGHGYPHGLQKDEIPISAQVVSIADVYDALTSERVYKPPYSHEEALDMIFHGECGVFNPILLECLQNVAPYLKEQLNKKSYDELIPIESPIMAYDVHDISYHTLSLLEQERTKYQFYLSLSKEIQFEYNFDSDVLILSDWGAHILDVPSVIISPTLHDGLNNAIDPQQVIELKEKINQATPENPYVSMIIHIFVQGQIKYFNAFMRPLWIDENPQMRTKLIGKLINIDQFHHEVMDIKGLQSKGFMDPLLEELQAASTINEILKENPDKTFDLAILQLEFINPLHYHQFGKMTMNYFEKKIELYTEKNAIACRINDNAFIIFNLHNQNDYQDLYQTLHGYDFILTIGVAESGHDGDIYEKLFYRANQALYSCKQDKSQNFCYYKEDMRKNPLGLNNKKS